ncbi:hypothetical protein BN14_10487 [Rhizoctonia solani AG-1 IB]|uniref:Uncharacterized protein n=1 Tax=Thanatephorus cucumeris (strain AG1-IB / isolate 7/3/14) TaxID=1108050 RepID=M5C8M6_THACB|nr:hypothetical protein BN14_10487 [Rhizoctonia solani AG-1 IB]
MYLKGELTAEEVEERSIQARKRYQELYKKRTPDHLMEAVLTAGQELIGEPPGEAGRGGNRVDRHGKPIGFNLQKVLGLEDSPGTYCFEQSIVYECGSAQGINWNLTYLQQTDAAKFNTIQAVLREAPIYHLYVNQWPIHCFLKGLRRGQKDKKAKLVTKMKEEGAPIIERSMSRSMGPGGSRSRAESSQISAKANSKNLNSHHNRNRKDAGTSSTQVSSTVRSAHAGISQFDRTADPRSEDEDNDDDEDDNDNDKDEDKDEDQGDDDDDDDDDEDEDDEVETGRAFPKSKKRGRSNPDRNVPGAKVSYSLTLIQIDLRVPAKKQSRSMKLKDNLAEAVASSSARAQPRRKARATKKSAGTNKQEPPPMTMAEQKALARTKLRGKGKEKAY